MSEEDHDLLQSGAEDKLSHDNTNVETLLHDLRASRRTLEQLFVDTFQSFADRPSEWTTAVYEKRAELLSIKKEVFFARLIV